MFEMLILKSRRCGLATLKVRFDRLIFDDLVTVLKAAHEAGEFDPRGWHHRCRITGREPGQRKLPPPSRLLLMLTQPNLGAW